MNNKPTVLLPTIKKNRSCGYPLLALPQAIAIAKAFFDGFGDGPHTRSIAAKGLGYSSFSGAASGKIGALVHFGMLSRARGTYAFLPLAKEAFSYPEAGSGEALAALAQKPVLYRKLIARFLNKRLPEKLEEILSSDYGITQKAAPVAASNFIATMEFAGLLKEGQIFLPENGGAVSQEPSPPIFRPVKKEQSDRGGTINIRLSSGIEILFPDSMSYRLSMGEFAAEIKSLDEKANADGD